MSCETCPLDPADLERVLAPIEYSRTLPAQAYVSEEVFAWERRHFVEGSWVCVGRSDEISDPGEQLALDIGSEGVLLVRDASGALLAFSNVCRHRGHELLQGGESARARVIRCPYHAWVYDLDGTLKGAPNLRDVPGFDRSQHPLIPACVVEWSGWIFVNASGDAANFDQHIGGLGNVLQPYEPERLLVAARHDYLVAANWKLIAENYHECYHCSNIHPELCRVTPIDSGVDLVPDGSWAGGTMELMDRARTMSLTGESDGVMLRGLDHEQRRHVVYLQIFPNLLVSAHPDYVMTHRLEPLDTGHTAVQCSWLFPPEALEGKRFDPGYAVEFWDITNRQDWAACESVQRGAANRGFRPGPLSPQESTLYQLLTMTARGYLEGAVARPQIADVRLGQQSPVAGKGGA